MGNRYNEIIDEVYDKYDELFDSYYPAFSAPYPKRLTKEELVEEIKNGGKVIQEYELGVKIEESELSLEEMMLLELKLNRVPTKQITLTYNNETVSYYE
jgi:hypothetical protein